MNIPAGLQLHVTTWENDGDNYKTKVMSGLAEQDVKFYVALAQLFKPDKGFGNEGVGYGRYATPPETFLAAVAGVVAAFPPTDPETLEAYSSGDLDVIHECLLEDILGYTESYYDVPYFCRVVVSFKVYNIKQEIEEIALV